MARSYGRNVSCPRSDFNVFALIRMVTIFFAFTENAGNNFIVIVRGILG
jgi:hypothetical protein